MSKSLLLLLLCIGVGLYQNHGRLARWLHPPPPRIAGAEHVVLYATTWCGYCAKTRRFFTENQIAYQELDVEHSDEGRSEYEKLGGGGVPVIVVNDNVIRGYDPDAIIEALGTQP